jgi:hypothetical protein
MVSARRVVAVTLGLVGIGAFLGALAGAAAFAVVGGFTLLLTGSDGVWDELLFVALFFGAPLGAVTAPVLAWLLLRRVPLGRMFVWSVAGTVAGGIIGWITSSWAALGDNSLERAVDSALGGALVGCVATCILLRYRALRCAQPSA